MWFTSSRHVDHKVNTMTDTGMAVETNKLAT